MKVLVIGGGGREHAMAWKLSQSPKVTKVFVAPGNGGTALSNQFENVAIADVRELRTWAQAEKIGLTVVGPEAPLAAGVVDEFRAHGMRIFGPSKAAAQLESSKAFSKAFMRRHGIPTADYDTFTDPAAAHAFVDRLGAPIVIKADGLMAGKGVVVALTVEEAIAAIDQVFAGGGQEVLIEEFMEGEEASLFCLVDGETVIPFGSAQDHKRAFDGDLGPNTGGMGAYSPAPVLTAELEARAIAEIVVPTARAMVAEGSPYRGILYAGLMLTQSGPKLVEYNCRFGDPECQVLMPRLESDLLALLNAAAHGELAGAAPQWSQKSAITVVYASRGYPGPHQTGSEIRGIEDAEKEEGVIVFQAGTKRSGAKIVSNGGRVLNVTATGDTLREARDRAYRAAARIDWPDGFYRNDIGWRALD